MRVSTLTSNLVVSLALLSMTGTAAFAQVAAPIVYNGAISAERDGTTLAANYTITTDGMLGALQDSNIRAYTVDFFVNGVSDPTASFTSATPNSTEDVFGQSLIASPNFLTFDNGATPGGEPAFVLSNYPNLIEFQGFQGSGRDALQVSGGPGLAQNSTSGSYIIGRAAISPLPVQPVPEPATWAMMIVGMGAIGFVMRRQKVAAPIRYAA